MCRRHSEFNTYYYCNNHCYQTLVIVMVLKIERKKEPSTFLLLFPFPGFFKMKSPFNHRPEPYLPLSVILYCPLGILCCKLHSRNAFPVPFSKICNGYSTLFYFSVSFTLSGGERWGTAHSDIRIIYGLFHLDLILLLYPSRSKDCLDVINSYVLNLYIFSCLRADSLAKNQELFIAECSGEITDFGVRQIWV